MHVVLELYITECAVNLTFECTTHALRTEDAVFLVFIVIDFWYYFVPPFLQKVWNSNRNVLVGTR